MYKYIIFLISLVQIYSLASVSGAGSDTLNPNEALTINQSIKSQNGIYTLIMQNDGNLVLYKNQTTPLWASNTSGRNDVQKVIMQSDGNLVIYVSNNQPIWSSNTNGQIRSRLVMQDDGNLVIYKDSKAVWATNTMQTDSQTPTQLEILKKAGNFNILVKSSQPEDMIMVLVAFYCTKKTSGFYYAPGNCYLSQKIVSNPQLVKRFNYSNPTETIIILNRAGINLALTGSIKGFMIMASTTSMSPGTLPAPPQPPAESSTTPASLPSNVVYVPGEGYYWVLANGARIKAQSYNPDIKVTHTQSKLGWNGWPKSQAPYRPTGGMISYAGPSCRIDQIVTTKTYLFIPNSDQLIFGEKGSLNGIGQAYNNFRFESNFSSGPTGRTQGFTMDPNCVLKREEDAKYLTCNTGIPPEYLNLSYLQTMNTTTLSKLLAMANKSIQSWRPKQTIGLNIMLSGSLGCSIKKIVGDILNDTFGAVMLAMSIVIPGLDLLAAGEEVAAASSELGDAVGIGTSEASASPSEVLSDAGLDSAPDSREIFDSAKGIFTKIKKIIDIPKSAYSEIQNIINTRKDLAGQ